MCVFRGGRRRAEALSAHYCLLIKIIVPARERERERERAPRGGRSDAVTRVPPVGNSQYCSTKTSVYFLIGVNALIIIIDDPPNLFP